MGIHRHVEKPDHHLLPALFSKTYVNRRIGVQRIIRGIIEVGDALHPRAGLKNSRRPQLVVELPMKVIVVDLQQSLHGTVFARQGILEGLAAKMHVREKAEQKSVVWQGSRDL